jgi:DHA1 family bicyclomycin/chloramphenicol resistance-like MFS transporter
MSSHTSTLNGQAQSPPHQPSLLALIAVSTLSPFATTVIVPAMPAIQADYRTDYGAVQLVLSFFLASIAIAQIIIGPLSDRFGRRPVLLAGLGIFVVSSVFVALAPTIESLIAFRVLQGASGSAGIVLGRAIIRDLFERRNAASMIGYVTMGFAVAPMVAPLTGGILQEAFDWTAIFWFMAGLGLICLAVAWIDIGETNLARAKRIDFATLFGSFKELIRSPNFLLFAACASLASAVFFSYLGGAPYISDRLLGLSPTDYGSWFIVIPGGYAAGNFLSGRYAERIGVAWMIIIGSALTVIAIMVMTVLFAVGLVVPASLFLPMCVAGIGNGLVLPSAIAGAISVRPDIVGAASGLAGSMQVGSGAAISAISGIVLAGSETGMPLIWVMFVSALLALATAFAISAYCREQA